MMPIGPLMIEHRLIERMIRVMERELERIEERQSVEPRFIEVAVDFIRTYADRCHHGKEEDILFRDLKKKELTDEHRQTMADLELEHRWGRETVGRLVNAQGNYGQGDRESLAIIRDCMTQLVEFYPKHIEKEDKHFFLPVMTYLTEEEKKAMLQEEYDFDRTLFHEQYGKRVVQLEREILQADRRDPFHGR